MNPALFTPAEIDNELALTADFEATEDVDKARRRLTALTRKLDLPEMASKDQESVRLAVLEIHAQQQFVRNWIVANSDPSDAQKLRNPSVVHADFSTFRGYG